MAHRVSDPGRVLVAFRTIPPLGFFLVFLVGAGLLAGVGLALAPNPALGASVAAAPPLIAALAMSGSSLLVVDPASDPAFVVRRPALWALAQGREWIPPHEDGELAAVHLINLTAGSVGGVSGTGRALAHAEEERIVAAGVDVFLAAYGR